MKRKIQHKVMQMIANYIVYMLANAYSDEMFGYYFEMGAKLDAYAVAYHEIYLD
jgi:hypothetical protein